MIRHRRAGVRKSVSWRRLILPVGRARSSVTRHDRPDDESGFEPRSDESGAGVPAEFWSRGRLDAARVTIRPHDRTRIRYSSLTEEVPAPPPRLPRALSNGGNRPFLQTVGHRIGRS
jgi:hypothetical protein